MAAGYAQSWPGNEHAGTFDVASVDTIAQSNIAKSTCADIADGGEASLDGEACVFRASDGFAGNGNAQTLVAVVARITG